MVSDSSLRPWLQHQLAPGLAELQQRLQRLDQSQFPFDDRHELAAARQSVLLIQQQVRHLLANGRATDEEAGMAAETRSILIAHANPEFARTLADVLERQEWTATIVTSSAQVLAAVRQTRYTVALIDCHLADRDGWQTVRELRRGEAQRGLAAALKLPVVGLCDGLDATEPGCCFAAGMDDFVTVPLHKAELVQALERAIVAHQPGKPTRAVQPPHAPRANPADVSGGPEVDAAVRALELFVLGGRWDRVLRGAQQLRLESGAVAGGAADRLLQELETAASLRCPTQVERLLHQLPSVLANTAPRQCALQSTEAQG